MPDTEEEPGGEPDGRKDSCRNLEPVEKADMALSGIDLEAVDEATETDPSETAQSGTESESGDAARYGFQDVARGPGDVANDDMDWWFGGGADTVEDVGREAGDDFEWVVGGAPDAIEGVGEAVGRRQRGRRGAGGVRLRVRRHAAADGIGEEGRREQAECGLSFGTDTGAAERRDCRPSG